jgi:threonylcarbamoyladenosine tRNA methylthiotransferase MtaB
MESCRRELLALAEKGYREIVLTGIELTEYGKDLAERPTLNDLIRLSDACGVERLRLGSLDPRFADETFAQTCAGSRSLCHQFHLSLQSGCDATLKRMNRHYTTAEYMENVTRLRRYMDRPAITTDVIAGFPGETPEEFAQTVEFLRQVDFYEIHVFKYSVRKGTIAAKMKNQVPEDIKGERSDILLALTAAQAKSYRESFLGREEEILLEEKISLGEETFWTGHTMRYIQGLVPDREDLGPGMLVRGRITGLFADGGAVLLA